MRNLQVLLTTSSNIKATASFTQMPVEKLVAAVATTYGQMGLALQGYDQYEYLVLNVTLDLQGKDFQAAPRSALSQGTNECRKVL